MKSESRAVTAPDRWQLANTRKLLASTVTANFNLAWLATGTQKMDKFLTARPRKEGEARGEPAPKSKLAKRKYDETYLALGFTVKMVGDEQSPQCVICLRTLAADSLRPCKLKRHLKTNHVHLKDKPITFFRNKLTEHEGEH